MSSLAHRSKQTQTPLLEGAPPGRSYFGQAAAASASRQGGAPEPPQFRPQIMRSLRQHPRIAAGVAIAVCLGFVLLGIRAGLMYKAESLVYIDPIIPGGTTPQGTPGYDQFRYGSYLDQQMQTVTRPDTLVSALRALPSGTWRGAEESEQSAIGRLQKALVVDRVANAYEFSIRLTTANAGKSAAVVNAVANAYLRGGRKDELTQAGGRAQILSEERQRLTEQLKKDEAEQAALGANLGVANPSSEAGNPFDVQLTNLRTQLALAREAHDVAVAQFSSVSGGDATHQSGLAAVADESINADLGLGSLKSSINARRALIESDMAGLTPSNPRYKQDQNEAADLDRSLESMTAKLRVQAERRIQDKLRTDLQRTGAVEAQLNGQLAQETAKATGAGPKLQRASELAIDIHRLNDRYTAVDEALRTLQLETNGPGMAHLAVSAAVPDAPERSYRNIFLLAALPFGILFGIAAAVLARNMDKRLFVGADLEQTVGFAPLAVLPSREDVPEHVIDEYVLRLAAGVEGAYRTAAARTFVITAVSARTNTLELLHALARKLEELRLKILVMRASDLLAISSETAEHRIATLGSGDGQSLAPLHESEGIGSAKLERMKGDHDIILIDGEPLLHSATTEYVARCADATLLVAQSGVTLSTELTDAAGLLARLHVAGVGAVLEDLRLKYADEAFKSAMGVVELRTTAGDRKHLAQRAQERKLSAAIASASAKEGPFGASPVAGTPAPAEAATATQAAFMKEPPVQVAEDETPDITPLKSREYVTSTASDWYEERAVSRREPEYEKSGSEHSRSVVIRPRRALRKFDGEEGLAVADFASSVPFAREEVSGYGSTEPPLDGYDLAVGVPMQGVALAERGDASPVAVAETTLDEEKKVYGLIVAGGVKLKEARNADVEEELSEREGIATHTRSTIRFSFKEPEVNSKKTWFSKLFRGDPPSTFKVIPDEAEYGAVDHEWHPMERLPEPTGPQEPGFEHLMSRINSVSRRSAHDEEEPAVGAVTVNSSAEERAYPDDPGAADEPSVCVAEHASQGHSFQRLVDDAFWEPHAPAEDEPREEMVRDRAREDDFGQLLDDLSPAETEIWPVKEPLPNLSERSAVEQVYRVPANLTEPEYDAAGVLVTEPARGRPEVTDFREELGHEDIPEVRGAFMTNTHSEPQRWQHEASSTSEAGSVKAEHEPNPPVPLAGEAAAVAVYPKAEILPVRGLSRRWALLSQYDPNLTDPLPSTHRSNAKFEESSPRRREEGKA